MPRNKGFTLIELLVVIGLVAVLSVVVILTLNPAELLRQARDSNRISDLATIRSGVALYLSDVASPNLASTSAGYVNVYISNVTTANPVAATWGVTAAYATSTGSTSTKVDSTGWLPVNFSAISAGSPIGKLPLDPINDGNKFYEYVATASNLGFKVVARQIESSKYGLNGSADVVSNDGDSVSTSTYSVGTNLKL